tara:strand:- start:190 stop:642 length:453 start_codon:yes stop_codon:yes gene_type:complete
MSVIENNNSLIQTITSKIEPGVMLHQIFKPKNLSPERINISPEHESLQVAYIGLKLDQTFKAHKHVIHDRNMPMAQESWIVISGKVKVFHYDLDDKIINESILLPGDCTITYRGGHNYLALEERTFVYEVKTGPYHGVENDKTFIKNSPH